MGSKIFKIIIIIIIIIIISKIRNLYGDILNTNFRLDMWIDRYVSYDGILKYPNNYTVWSKHPVSFTGCPKSSFIVLMFTFQENGTVFRN